MSNLNINYEGIYQKHYEEIHQNIKYLFEQAIYYNDDGALGKEKVLLLNYYSLVNFKILGENNLTIFDTLDLTWMNKKNTIAMMPGNKQYEEIKNIKVNVENLCGSFLPRKESNQRDINIIIYPGDTKLNYLKQKEIINEFIAMNWDVINSITLKDFNPVSFMLLSAFIERKDVKLIIDTSPKEDKKVLFKKQ